MAPPHFARAVAWGLYGGRMRDAIHALKYGRVLSLADPLGERLANAIARLAPDSPAEWLVVPVPLYRRKQQERGFNQARMLAEKALGVLRRTHPEWKLTLEPELLRRKRPTTSQAGLTPRGRRLNMRGAFAVPEPEAVAGRDVLLIDDILTTGATARSAAAALMHAGAGQVYVATLARALRALPARGESDAVSWNAPEGVPAVPPQFHTSLYSQHVSGSLPSL